MGSRTMEAGVDRDVERHLIDHGVRYTSGRRTVVAALGAADGPRSASELHSDVAGAIPLSSIYRTLAVLEEAGVVVPHFGAKDVTRYELAEWLTGHHHHVICVECGSVEDVAVPPPYEQQVRELVDGIGSVIAFTPTAHTLEIEGRCAACA